MKGWIRLYRVLIEKPIWLNSTPEQKSVLITLLLLANHDINEWEWTGQKFKVKPGQFITSLESIRSQAGKGISIQNVRSSLKRFEKLGFLTYESTTNGRIISICNWTDYQQAVNETQHSIQQRSNKDVTTNKNDKINEKYKKNINKSESSDIFISQGHLQITWDEMNKLIDEFGEEKSNEFVQRVLNYGKNSKYKSLYLTARNWLNREKKKIADRKTTRRLAS